MQTSYVVKKSVYLQPGSIKVQTGDILVFNASNNHSLTIYRDQQIVGTITKHSLLSLDGFISNHIIEAIDTTPEAANYDPTLEKLSLSEKIEESFIVAELATQVAAGDAITFVENVAATVTEETKAETEKISADVAAEPQVAKVKAKGKKIAEAIVENTSEVKATVEAKAKEVAAAAETIVEDVEKKS